MSRRMGRDKGSMVIGNKPLIVHVVENIRDAADELVIVLRDQVQLEKYRNILKDIELSKTDIKICTDITPDQGPLMGILTGLTSINSEKALILPCDSPCISSSFLSKMFKYSEISTYDAFVPRWSDNSLEPLHGVYKKTSIPTIKKLLKEDVRDVKTLISKLNVKFIDAQSLDDSGRNFLNLNQIEDVSSI